MKPKNVHKGAARGVRLQQSVKPDTGPAERERVALYLTATESEKLKGMRLVVVTAGLKPSDNSLVLAALRTLDLGKPERFVAAYRDVQANDRRRR